jgi:hypothetical protein
MGGDVAIEKYVEGHGRHIRSRGGGGVRCDALEREAERGSGEDDPGVRHREAEERDERGERESDVCAPAQRAASDAQQRLDDQREHGGLHAEEERGDERDAAPGRVEQRERRHHERSRQHEEEARREPAARAVQQPADVGRELLRLGARQQHAVRRRVPEALLADPTLPLDEHALHHRDLARGPAEALEPDAEPGAERLAEGDGHDHSAASARRAAGFASSA